MRNNSRIVRWPFLLAHADAIEREPHDLLVPASGPFEQQLRGNAGARRVLLRSCQQHAGAIDHAAGTRGGRIDDGAVLFEQRDHPPIASRMRLHDRCAAGVDIRVRVGATFQQQFGKSRTDPPRRWIETGVGGHFLEWEEPALVARELQTFFASLRSAR